MILVTTFPLKTLTHLDFLPQNYFFCRLSPLQLLAAVSFQKREELFSLRHPFIRILFYRLSICRTLKLCEVYSSEFNKNKRLVIVGNNTDSADFTHLVQMMQFWQVLTQYILLFLTIQQVLALNDAYLVVIFIR